MDTLYRYRISVAKSSKRSNIGEYSNCCRLVHHQKSISEIPEKDGLVPCAVDGFNTVVNVGVRATLAR